LSNSQEETSDIIPELSLQEEHILSFPFFDARLGQIMWEERTNKFFVIIYTLIPFHLRLGFSNACLHFLFDTSMLQAKEVTEIRIYQ
jgi:hypothetical protein